MIKGQTKKNILQQISWEKVESLTDTCDKDLSNMA